MILFFCCGGFSSFVKELEDIAYETVNWPRRHSLSGYTGVSGIKSFFPLGCSYSSLIDTYIAATTRTHLDLVPAGLDRKAASAAMCRLGCIRIKVQVGSVTAAIGRPDDVPRLGSTAGSPEELPMRPREPTVSSAPLNAVFACLSSQGSHSKKRTKLPCGNMTITMLQKPSGHSRAERSQE